MTDSTSKLGTIGLALLAGFLLVTPALAGCVGGGAGGDSGTDPAEGNGSDGEIGPGGGPGGTDDVQEHVHNRWKTGDDQLTGQDTDVIPLVDTRDVTVRSFRIGQDPESTDTEQPMTDCAGSPEGDSPFCRGEKIITTDVTGEDGTRTMVVPPNTDRITMTFQYDESELNYWTGDEPASTGEGHGGGIFVWYQDKAQRRAGGWTQIASPAESGTTYVIENVTDFDEADDPRQVQVDDGHAKVSAWRWKLGVRGNPLPASSPWYPNAHFADHDGVPVTVTIKAHREDGPLPFEPPHPEFYQDNADNPTDVYQIAKVNGETQNQFLQAGVVTAEPSSGCSYEPLGQCVPVSFFEQGLFWWTSPGKIGSRMNTQPENRPVEWGSMEGATNAKALVPPKTAKLVAVLEFNSASSQQGDAEFCLRGRTPAMDGRYGKILDDEDTACQVYDGNDTMKLSATIGDGDVDSFYANNWGQNASRWTFLLQLRSAGSNSAAAGVSTYEPAEFSGDFSAVFFTTNGAGLAEVPSWANFG